MFENINIHSSVAVYEQIENEVRFAVAAGKLKPGDRLPSIQELSEKLDLNPNTVAKSYRDLDVMGIVYARRGMGVFINKGAEHKCAEECRRWILERIHEVVNEAKAAGMSASEIKAVCEKSYAVGYAPYTPAPSEILAMAKIKKS